MSGDRYKTTSTSTLTVDNSTQTCTVSAGLSYSIGQQIVVTYDASNFITATLLSYDQGTGSLTFDGQQHTGSGTYSDWTVNLAGAAGGDGTSGTDGSSGTSGTSGSSGTDGAVEGYLDKSNNLYLIIFATGQNPVNLTFADKEINGYIWSYPSDIVDIKNIKLLQD